jgi:hypothetical protein
MSTAALSERPKGSSDSRLLEKARRLGLQLPLDLERL